MSMDGGFGLGDGAPASMPTSGLGMDSNPHTPSYGVRGPGDYYDLLQDDEEQHGESAQEVDEEPEQKTVKREKRQSAKDFARDIADGRAEHDDDAIDEKEKVTRPEKQAKDAKPEKVDENTFKRLKNAVPALQRQNQELREQIKTQAESIRNEVRASLQEEIRSWFTKNPNEVIETVLSLNNIDKGKFHRDEFTKALEFEQMPEEQKQILRENERLRQRQAEIERREQEAEARARQQEEYQKQQAEAQTLAQTAQIMTKFCDTYGLDKANPQVYHRILDTLQGFYQGLDRNDPLFAQATDEDLAEFYREGSYKETVYNLKNLNPQSLEGKPYADELVAAILSAAKVLAKKGGAVMPKMQSERMVSRAAHNPKDTGPMTMDKLLRELSEN